MLVFRLNWCIKKTLDLLEWSMKLEKQKEVELTLCRLVTLGMTRDRDQVCQLVQSVPTRCSHVSPKHCNFSVLSSFRILAITSSTDIQMRWFKLPWKDNQRSRTFMKGLSEDKVIWNDKNALKFTIFIKSCNPLFKEYLSNCNFF